MTGLTNLHDAGPPGVPEIVAALEEDIVTGHRPAGSRLPSERALADTCSVSRPVIREALRALTERGLISVSAGRGSFVRRLDPSMAGASADLLARGGQVTARDLIVARSMLEAETAALAALNRTDEQLQQMQDLLEVVASSTMPITANLDLAFHECISIASANPVLQLMFGSIRNLTHAIMLRSLTDRKVAGEALPLHHVILNAIVDQDPDEARRAMVEHIGTARKFYGPDLDIPLAEVIRARAETSPSLSAVLRGVSMSLTDRTPG